MTVNTIAKRINELRIAANETQDDLASLLSCNRASIANYENGKRTPDINMIIKIAKHYGTTTDYLLGATDNKTTDINIQNISKYTGLNEDSISFLNTVVETIDFCKNSDYEIEQHINEKFLEILNFLLTSKSVCEMLNEIVEYQDNLKKTIQEYKLIVGDLEEYTNDDKEVFEDLLFSLSFVDAENYYKFSLCNFYEAQRYFSEIIRAFVSSELEQYDYIKDKIDKKMRIIKDGEDNGKN